MTKTKILLFHRNLAQSKANAAMSAAAASLPSVEVVDMQALYPDSIDMLRDGEYEAARLLAADRIVLQFPIQWYSTPPLLKAWQDAVLTRMFYFNYETEGQKLKGTPIMLAVTAGAASDVKRPDGLNIFSMADLLVPLRATAHRCGLLWQDPFILYNADKLSPEALGVEALRYATALERWVIATANARFPDRLQPSCPGDQVKPARLAVLA